MIVRSRIRSALSTTLRTRRVSTVLAVAPNSDTRMCDRSHQVTLFLTCIGPRYDQIIDFFNLFSLITVTCIPIYRKQTIAQQLVEINE
jgi:hypothetical protein